MAIRYLLRIGFDCMAMSCHNLDTGKPNTNTHKKARSGTGRQTKFILDKPKSAYGDVTLFHRLLRDMRVLIQVP